MVKRKVKRVLVSDRPSLVEAAAVGFFLYILVSERKAPPSHILQQMSK